MCSRQTGWNKFRIPKQLTISRLNLAQWLQKYWWSGTALNSLNLRAEKVSLSLSLHLQGFDCLDDSTIKKRWRVSHLVPRGTKHTDNTTIVTLINLCELVTKPKTFTRARCKSLRDMRSRLSSFPGQRKLFALVTRLLEAPGKKKAWVVAPH